MSRVGAAAIELHFLLGIRRQDDGIRRVAGDGILKAETTHLELRLASEQCWHAALKEALAQAAGHRVVEIAHNDAKLRLSIAVELLQDARILRVGQQLGNDRLPFGVSLCSGPQLQVLRDECHDIYEQLPDVRECLDRVSLPGLAVDARHRSRGSST